MFLGGPFCLALLCVLGVYARKSKAMRRWRIASSTQSPATVTSQSELSSRQQHAPQPQNLPRADAPNEDRSSRPYQATNEADNPTYADFPPAYNELDPPTYEQASTSKIFKVATLPGEGS